MRVKLTASKPSLWSKSYGTGVYHSLTVYAGTCFPWICIQGAKSELSDQALSVKPGTSISKQRGLQCLLFARLVLSSLSEPFCIISQLLKSGNHVFISIKRERKSLKYKFKYIVQILRIQYSYIYSARAFGTSKNKSAATYHILLVPKKMLHFKDDKTFINERGVLTNCFSVMIKLSCRQNF